MPQVPYSGVPTVAPQMDPTPRYTADVTPDMFGVNIGHAISQLGSASDAVGNEIFARGLAMQDLANHSEAETATAKFMEQAGNIHAKLDSMQGKDAVDYYANGFKQDLDKAHTDIAATLSNPMSQKIFNTEALSTIGRTMFNGATVAGQANKQYAINSIESRIKNQTDLAATSNNPDDVAAAKAQVNTLAAQRGALKGQDQDSVDEYAKTINSSLDLNVIKETARREPSKAKEMLDERRDGMTAADFDHAQAIVDNSMRAVGSVNIAQKVISSHIGDDGKPDTSFENMQAEAEAEAKKVAPDDALMVKHTTDALKGLYNQKIYADKQFKYENTQTIDAAIQGGAKDIQTLRADPKIAEAIDNLPKSEQLKIPTRINAYNAAATKVANQDSLTRIAGLRNNDVESFLNLDPTDPKLQLNQSQQREVMGWQQADKKNQNGDPRVNRALTWLRDARGGELQALGVYHRDSRDPDDYDHMTGTLQSALDLWQESKGKPPTYDEVVNQIGPQVIKSRAVPGSLWGTRDEPFYKPDVNSTEYKNFSGQVTKDIQDQGKPPPTPAEIDRAYNRMQLLKLYPPKAKPSGG
jgi:hypothetical protein